MTMNKGLAVIEVNDTETKGFFIDQDALEFSRLNAKVKKRLDQAMKSKKKATATNTKAERAKAERKAYTMKTAAHILLDGAVCCGVVWAGIAGLIAPVIYIPVSVFCLCAACLRLGAWFGKR